MAGSYVTVTYHPHARRRRQLRLVSEAQIERTIANPTRTMPSTNPPGRTVAERVTAAGNTLRVVYVERSTPDGTEAFVLTVIRRGGTSP